MHMFLCLSLYILHDCSSSTSAITSTCLFTQRRPTMSVDSKVLPFLTLSIIRCAAVTLSISLCRKLIGCFGRSPTRSSSIDGRNPRRIQHPLHRNDQRGTRLLRISTSWRRPRRHASTTVRCNLSAIQGEPDSGLKYTPLLSYPLCSQDCECIIIIDILVIGVKESDIPLP